MSEFSIIKQYFDAITEPHKYTLYGIGDDCAVSRVPAGCELVSCVDTLVAGRHFVVDADPYAIGHKAVAVNLSDLAAMGATPYAILLGLSLPKSMANYAFLSRFASGLANICNRFGVELIGGDTTRSDVLTISITALGFVPQAEAITRKGAQVGDMVFVSGEIGSASLALLHQSLGQKSALQHALDLPNPQVALGQKLLGFASSMIDISDGLGQDLGHILTASGVGASIELNKIPCHEALSGLPDDARWQHLINGGDDYELCFTLNQDNLMSFTRKYPSTLIYPIGYIHQELGLNLLVDEMPIKLQVAGYQHF